MKIHKKERIQTNLIEDKNYVQMDKKLIKPNNIELKNNNEIRKISLPIRKNCFNSPKRKKLIINKTDSFQSNSSTNYINNKEENIYFSFGKIKKQNKGKDINSKQNKLTPKFKKENVLTEKNNMNNENISLNVDEPIKKNRKKNIIPKPNNIKKNYLNSFTNNNIYNSIKNDEKNFIKNNNKTLTETSETFYNFGKRKEEKDLKVIEEFMKNFKNKERSESLKKALNMYKRYKSSSNFNFENELNNSCCELKSMKNKLKEQKSEGNLLSKKKINKISKNKSNINRYNLKNNFNSYQNINQNNCENKKVKRFFLRKIIREEKCYRDNNGNIHVIDINQSLINDEDKPVISKNKKIIRKDFSHESFQVKNIQNKNKIYIPINDKIRNTEYDKNCNKLRIINISKRVNHNNYPNNTHNFIQPQKVKIIKYKNKCDNISYNISNNYEIVNSPRNKIEYIKAGPIQRNHSYQYLYNLNENQFKYNSNINEFYNNNINYRYAHNTNYDLSRYKKRIINNYIDNSNCYNNYNDFKGNYYKKESYPESDKTFLINRNNSNCCFYESKSLSKDRQKKLRHNNSYIIF